jgi:hypothetical protein
VSCHAAPCSPAMHGHFGRMYFLHLQGRNVSQACSWHGLDRRRVTGLARGHPGELTREPTTQDSKVAVGGQLQASFSSAAPSPGTTELSRVSEIALLAQSTDWLRGRRPGFDPWYSLVFNLRCQVSCNLLVSGCPV